MTDAELVARLQENDGDAFREVLTRYGDQLYRYIVSITGEPQLSEDIVGETYLRMVERVDGYRYTGAPFKAWLFRIAHNLAVNALRRGNRQVVVDDLDQVARPATDPALRVASQLEAEELRTALLQLTEEQQQVVLLRFVAGMSTSEVAQALEKTENAVKQMQFRALRSLERLMERPT